METPPPLRRIQGQKDHVMRLLRDVQTRAGRATHNAFTAQTPELVTRAFQYGGQPLALILSDTFAETPEALALRQLAAQHKCLAHRASDGLLAKILGKRPMPRCAAICPRPTADARSLARQGGIVQIVEDLENPDNLGMLLRSAEAAGCAGVILTGEGCCDPFTKRSVRGSRGAVFHLPIVEHPDTQDLLTILREEGVYTVASSANTGTRHDDISYQDRPVALLVGNEHVGLRDETVAACDTTVRIPMRGKINSLNVSVAASILMYEATRHLT